MATKKRTNNKKKPVAPAGIPPVKKMIDLTKDKTDSKATKFVNAVSKMFIKSVQKMRIPVCDMFATNPNMLNGYMRNRTQYQAFIDDCGNLMDQCLRDAIAQTVLEQLTYPEMKKVNFPGKWDDHNMFALVRSRVNIIVPLDRPELGGYLTIHEISPNHPGYTTEQMKEEGNAISFMRMAEYNPNRLYQFAIVVNEAVINVLNYSITHGIPSAYLCDANERLISRYGRELVEVTKDTVRDWAEHVWALTGMTYNKKMERLCHSLYTPVMKYVTTLLGLSGIKSEYIVKILDPEVSVLKITHFAEVGDTSDPMNSAVQFQLINKNTDLIQPGTKEPYIVPITIVLNLGMLYRCTMSDTPKKTEINILGEQIKTFIGNMMPHIFNMYVMGALFTNNKSEDHSEPIDMVEGEETE